ncbi:MAG: 4-(cytidine 5'-diphospho)-2-C-methyl-D-erythritol kinase [Planctomycetes bacterium]|nr:4-(cytidine 5'-diphospho)-2-C-methyl-D-erythritol kinase [Planctomycetota bacterium]
MRIESLPDGSVRALAPAKLNLYLELLGKRPDGYHEIETVMLAVSLCDELVFSPAESGISLTCDRPDLPCDESNLVLRAARLLAAEAGVRAGAVIRLAKRAPMGAGMGGGSSDAAAALAGLDRLWGLGLPRERLAGLGARLGSDVPFFFSGPLAVCRGRGERVEPLPPPPPLHFVVVWPEVHCPTAEVYRRVRIGLTPRRDGVSLVRSALAAGSIPDLGAALFNRLEEPAHGLFPRLAAVRDALVGIGFAGVLTTGSGSAIFGLCRSAEEAVRREQETARRGLGRVFRVQGFA